MNLRNLVVATSLLVALLPGADAAAAGAKKPPLSKDQKKALEIERHQWMAQYYVLRANDLEGAVREYKAILTLDPQNEPAVLALSSLYRRDKKEKLAVEILTKETKKNPKAKNAWLTLADIQAGNGDEAGMKASIAQVLAIDPANITAYWLRFENAYRHAKAGDAAAKAEALDSARKLAQLAKGTTAPSFRRVERAIVELGGQPIDLTIYDAKTAFASAFDAGLLANINAKMGMARRGFEECTRTAPTNEECHYYLGLVYSSVAASESYDPNKALAELALAPSLPAARIEEARLLRAAGKDTEARAALEKALALDASLAAAHLELGILDKVDGKTDAATGHFVAAIQADRYGSSGERAFSELAKVSPEHPLVTEGVFEGRGGDLFSTERYKALVALIEQTFGGVEANAPERATVEDVVRKLAEASAVRQTFRVQVVASTIPNAFALADGRVYVTRGLLQMLAKSSGGKPVDAKNDLLGHVMAHELVHVIRRHTMNTMVFQQAIKDTSRPLDVAVLTHVTRLHEIEADREGMVMAFLAGYHPRGGIEFMEVMGKEQEIPKHLDHPTFQERVDYLSEYWTNEVRYAFVSFKLGVDAMDRGAALEATDMEKAVGAYQAAVDHFRRFHAMLPSLKEAMNDLGIAYAKLGVLAMNRSDSPLGRWQTRFSLERESAVKYVALVRDDDKSRTRGGDKARLPSQLREAIASFKEALSIDESYGKARLNLATAYLAANQLDNATAALAKIDSNGGVAGTDVDLVRGVALAEAKDYDKARASFERARGAADTKRAASFNLARALELGGKKADAKRAYQDYAKAYPSGPWATAAQTAAAKL
jgi:predicted Zn-dependent protease